MKTIMYAVGVALAGGLAVSQAQAAAPQNLFVSADRKVEAVAGCVVDANSNGAAAACLCYHSHNAFDFCDGDPDSLPLGLFDATGILTGDEDEAYTKLSGKVQTVGSFNDLLIEVAGSCTLGGADGELIFWSPDERDFPLTLDAELKGKYAAVYMWPEVNHEAVGQPVRLCAHGDLSLLGAVGGLADASENAQAQTLQLEPFVLGLGYNEQDIGGTYAFQWALEDVKKKGCYHHGHREALGLEHHDHSCDKPAFRQENHVKVHFLAVAGVEAGVLSNTDYTAVAVWANAKLKERSMHVEAQKLEVEHEHHHGGHGGPGGPGGQF
jgi:hypothetical protein